MLKEALGYSTSKSQSNWLLLEIVFIPLCSLGRQVTCSYLPLIVRIWKDVDEIQPFLRVIALTWLQILWQGVNLAAVDEHPILLVAVAHGWVPSQGAHHCMGGMSQCGMLPGCSDHCEVQAWKLRSSFEMNGLKFWGFSEGNAGAQPCGFSSKFGKTWLVTCKGLEKNIQQYSICKMYF